VLILLVECCLQQAEFNTQLSVVCVVAVSACACAFDVGECVVVAIYVAVYYTDTMLHFTTAAMLC
jgi:hypothetical protein